MKLTVVLPTYNESKNIVKLINSIYEVIPNNITPEIIVVDDNSPDETYAIVTEYFKADKSVKTVLRTEERGLAKSILCGIKNATGEFILIMETDFTHDPLEIPKLLHVSKIYDLVSCSRFCAGGNMQDRKHYIASFTYNLLLRLILRTQVQDNLGGYFIISRKALMTLPLDSIFFGYGDYYFRLLHFAQKNDFSIVEIPALYLDRSEGQSKSNFFKMIFSYGWAAVKLKLGQKKDPV